MDPSSQPTQPLTEGELDTMRSSINHAIYRSQYGMHGLSIEAERRLLAEVFRLRAENTAQAERIAAAGKLHFEKSSLVFDMSWCFACGDNWPCPTAAALGLDPNEEGQANG